MFVGADAGETKYVEEKRIGCSLRTEPYFSSWGGRGVREEERKSTGIAFHAGI